MSVQPNEKYEAVVIDASLSVAATGSPSIFLSLKTVDGVIGNDLWCTPSALDRTREVMEKCFGITNDDLSAMYRSDDWSRLKGRDVSITTIEEEYQGDMKTKVQWMNPAGGGRKKVDPAAKAKLGNLFGGGGSAPPQRERQTITPQEDPDCPF